MAKNLERFIDIFKRHPKLASVAGGSMLAAGIFASSKIPKYLQRRVSLGPPMEPPEQDDPMSVTMFELRLELSKLKPKEAGSTISDGDIISYIKHTFGFLNKTKNGSRPSKPLDLNDYPEALKSLLALVCNWVYVQHDVLVYLTKGSKVVRDQVARQGAGGSSYHRVLGVYEKNNEDSRILSTVSEMKQQIHKTNMQVNFKFKLLIDGKLEEAREDQELALRCIIEDWWRIEGNLVYKTPDNQQLLLVRRYNKYDIKISRVASWEVGNVPSVEEIEEKEITIFTPKGVLLAFRQNLTENLSNKIVYNAYRDQTSKIECSPNKPLQPFHLQALARNEEMNTTGEIVDSKHYPGLNEDHNMRYILARILRCLVKFSIVASVVKCHHYGGYNGHPHKSREGNIILIDQPGFQWQDDFFNTGGLFFYPSVVRKSTISENYWEWNEWIKICFTIIFGYYRPHEPFRKIEVTWSGVPGSMCTDQIKKGFSLEFAQAFECANYMAKKIEKKAYFRFLKAGLGFFSAKLDPTTRTRLHPLRLEGIAEALESIYEKRKENPEIAKNVGSLELPYSGGDDEETMNRINKTCQKLGISFEGGPVVDALEPIKDNTMILAVTNCGDPHTAIGNKGNFWSVDAAIATNTHSKHMVVAAHMDNFYAYDEVTHQSLDLSYT